MADQIDETSGLNETYDKPVDEPTVEWTLENYRLVSFAIAWTTLGFCLLGVVSNALSIYVYAQPGMSRTAINVLLIGLSVTDLCLSVLSVPAFVAPGLNAYYNLKSLHAVTSYSAVLIYPLTSAAHSSGVWILVVITLERWHTVCRDFGEGRHSVVYRRRRSASVKALLGVWALALAYNFVRFFEYRVDYVPDERDGQRPMALPILRDPDAYPAYISVYYVGLFLCTHFLLPYAAFILINGLTLRAVYVARRRRRRLLSRQQHSEHRLTCMLLTVMSCFLLCYALLFALNVMEAVNGEWFQMRRNRVLAYALNDLSNTLVVCNSATTVFIYFAFNRKYRTLCCAFLSRCFPTRCWPARPLDAVRTVADLHQLSVRRTIMMTTSSAQPRKHQQYPLSDAVPLMTFC